MAERIERKRHHHNSRRFRCSCGELHIWGSNLETGDGYTCEISCQCGLVHWKPQANFRGESKHWEQIEDG